MQLHKTIKESKGWAHESTDSLFVCVHVVFSLVNVLLALISLIYLGQLCISYLSYLCFGPLENPTNVLYYHHWWYILKRPVDGCMDLYVCERVCFSMMSKKDSTRKRLGAPCNISMGRVFYGCFTGFEESSMHESTSGYHMFEQWQSVCVMKNALQLNRMKGGGATSNEWKK